MSHLFMSGKDPAHIKIEYRIIPTEAYRIMRNCAGCNASGGKSIYESTGCFRVNANGNKLDVWLIYQCPECKHTYNLGIYERLKREALDEKEYHHFLTNDAGTALRYGLDKNVFVRNKAQIVDGALYYELYKLNGGAVAFEELYEEPEIRLVIENPYGLRIRTEHVVADILGISRSKAKKLIATANPKYIGQSVTICFTREDYIESGK